MIKRSALFFVLLIILLCLIVSCGENDAISEVEITYVFGNGMDNKVVKISKDNFDVPADPKTDGYTFIGWCTDEERTSFYNFDNFPNGDIKLYAAWCLDYKMIGEQLNTYAMKFNVMIRSVHYLSGAFFASETSQGSGVIYKESDGYYYALTNAHVLIKSDEYIYNSYTVYDCFGNSYAAEYIVSDRDYDLGVLRFKKSETLSIARIDERIPWKNETLISMGSPQGMLNTITYGDIYSYKTLDPSSSGGIDNSIDFAVLWHKAYANHGSSGGALLDSKLELIGINFAVATNMSGDFLYCFAVPSVKINEFLEINGIK